MIHHRQRLPLGLEPRDDRLGIHAQLDDLERHPAPDRFGLLGDINHAAPALADLLQQLVATERLADGFVSRCLGERDFHGALRCGFAAVFCFGFV